jgi:hypothetical protein
MAARTSFSAFELVEAAERTRVEKRIQTIVFIDRSPSSRKRLYPRLLDLHCVSAISIHHRRPGIQGIGGWISDFGWAATIYSVLDRSRWRRAGKHLIMRFRFLFGVRGCVIPNGLARKRLPLGCLVRFIFQDFHFLGVIRLRRGFLCKDRVQAPAGSQSIPFPDPVAFWAYHQVRLVPVVASRF